MKNVLRITLPRAIEQGAIIVNLHGQLEGRDALQVKEQLSDVLSVYHQDCTINIPNDTSIDLGGLNSLIQLQRIQSANGTKLKVVSKRDSHVTKYIKLAGLDRHIQLQYA